MAGSSSSFEFICSAGAIFVGVASRVSPRQATHFLLLRQEKVSKEKASRMRRPCAALRAHCVARPGRGLARTRLRLKQSRALVRPALRYSPTHNGVGGSATRPALPDIAARGEALVSPVQCGAKRHEHSLSSQPPSVCAEERRTRRIRTGDCLSRRRVRARPRLVRAPQVARSRAEGRRQWGRFSLLTFFGEAKKVSAQSGARPDTAPHSNKGSQTC